MDTIFFHPKVVHLPIALAVLVPLLASGVLLAWWQRWLPSRAWFIPLVLQILLVVSAFVAMQTGERDEERVEAVVPEAALEAHEEAAEVFLWMGAGVLGLMAAAGALKDHRLGLPLGLAATVAATVGLGLGYRVGEAGGALVYRHGAATAFTGAPAQVGDGSASAAGPMIAKSEGASQPAGDEDEGEDDDDD